MGILDEAEPREMEMLNSPLGTLETRQAIDAVWLCEGLAVLAWALQRFPLPRHDEEVQPWDVAEALDFLCDEAADLLNVPTLRSKAEIDWLGDQLYDVNVRLRQFRRHSQPEDFAAAIHEDGNGKIASFAAYVRFAESDLAIGSLPIFKAAKDDLETVVSVSRVRHEAVNWLLGQEKLYSRVTANT